MEKKELKTALRKEKIQMRRELGEDRVSALSCKICARILESEEYKQAKTILVYNAVNNEVSLENIAKAAEADGKRVAYPLCLDEGKMEAYVPKSKEAFAPGAYGIMEPVASLCEKIEPGDLDLVICPLTAFDDKCQRLGMGGGYYDRYIPRCKNAVIAAAAYEMQKADAVPFDENDVTVDIIFTETQVYRANAKQRL